MVDIAWIHEPTLFPDTNNALKNPNGLLAVSSDIDADWLTAAYSRGIFPWYNPGEPVLWWTPSPRAVLYLDNFKLHRSLRKTLRKYSTDTARRITTDMAFERVITACAEPRADSDGTWIDEKIIAAYTDLHRRGLAHSVEHWLGDQLVGGLYCVSIGTMVYGESMFSRETDASKVAFAILINWLRSQNVRMIDCQQATQHLLSLGAIRLPRNDFEMALTEYGKSGQIDWQKRVLSWGP